MGLFIACYKIGGGKPGAPLFDLHLCVNTPDKSVSGMGQLTQAVSPPLNLKTQLTGDFTYMTVMPRNVHILVVATGYPSIAWPPGGGIGPVLQPNASIRMVLEEDWKSGTATYKYVDNKGTWRDVENAAVKLVPCNAPS